MDFIKKSNRITLRAFSYVRFQDQSNFEIEQSCQSRSNFGNLGVYTKAWVQSLRTRSGSNGAPLFDQTCLFSMPKIKIKIKIIMM